MLAIKNGKLVTIANGVIENGTLLVDGNKIVAIGPEVVIPAEAQVIDALLSQGVDTPVGSVLKLR